MERHTRCDAARSTLRGCTRSSDGLHPIPLARRRSSVAPGARQNDPRNIKDADFQRSAQHSVINFLTEHGYDRQISPRLLTQPTQKDFLAILSFLIKAIDPNFKFADKKFEDEVPSLFKALGYKFTIGKAALQTVGASHTWPQLLAAVNWLVELINYSEVALVQDAGDGFDNDDVNKIFFDYLARAYQMFLAGEDDTSELEDQLAMMIESKTSSVKQDIEMLTAANAGLGDEVHALTSGETPLQKARAINAELLADQEKFSKHYKDLSNYHAKISAQLEKNTDEHLAGEAELAQLKQEIEAAKVTISKQTVSVADVKRMRSEQTDLERELKLVKEQKSAADQQLYDTSAKLNRKLEQLDDSVQKANTSSRGLKMIPADAEHARGRCYVIELRKQHLASQPDELLSLELQQELMPAVQGRKAALQKELFARQDECVKAEEAAVKCEEEATECTETMQAQKTALDRLEKEEAAVRAQLSREMQERNQAVELLQERIIAARTSTATGGSSDFGRQKALDALHAEYDEFKATSHAEREKMYNDLVSALSMVTEHKEQIQAQINDLKEYCESKVVLLQPMLAKDGN